MKDADIKDKSEKRELHLACPMTPRELEVLQLIAEGYNTKLIASELNVTIYTVESHRKNLLEKLQAENICKAVAICLRKKWIV